MPEQQELPTKQIFDPALEQKADDFINQLTSLGAQISNKELVKSWFKDKIKKGFTTGSILESLKSNNYDLDATGRYLDNIYESQKKSEQAITAVKEVKSNLAKEKLQKKRASQITWIILAFTFAGVGVFTAIILNKQIEGTDISSFGMAASLLNNIIKFSWIIAISSGAVGVFLIFYALADYFKTRPKPEKGPAKDLQQKMQEIETKLESAEKGETIIQQSSQENQTQNLQQPLPAKPEQPKQFNNVQ